MSEVMAPYPVSARRGERISPMVPSLIPNNNLRHNGDDDDIKANLLNVLEQNQSLLEKYPFAAGDDGGDDADEKHHPGHYKQTHVHAWVNTYTNSKKHTSTN